MWLKVSIFNIRHSAMSYEVSELLAESCYVAGITEDGSIVTVQNISCNPEIGDFIFNRLSTPCELVHLHPHVMRINQNIHMAQFCSIIILDSNTNLTS